MKHLIQPRNAILREAHGANSSDSSSQSLWPGLKSKPSPPPSSSRRLKSAKENAPPSDLNFMPSVSPSSTARVRSPLPPRPPSSNPLKRKHSLEAVPENSFPDDSVKVILRVRPFPKDEEEGERLLEKISDASVSIDGQTFTFDSIADTETTQLDIFQLVGVPLVENCLAGFNSSVFAYGQTGSGKTYTMWGPANALLDENLLGDQHGLTPRVFKRLFERIDEEQTKYLNKQLIYHCRCSFLEIYNEQITDLLDPSQRNLQIREDVKSGVYVENLTEEYVFTMKDVTQLLKTGLSNRRTGATSINAESSRSHSVFTCIVESRCKSPEDGLSSLKTSRINLVDLAGSERQKLTSAAGDRLKEAGNINRSLSQLGNLINILAEVSQTGKQRHIPYRDSKLTFLLQESLGGNAKLLMLCAVSPAQSCKSETSSTLRFAQRVKAIKNKAVVNVKMEDNVDHLREVIRQLKDELDRVKANNKKSTGWDLRKSLSVLRSLNANLPLPKVDEDGDEEMEIDEEAVERLSIRVDLQPAATESCMRGKDAEGMDVDMEEGTSERVVRHESSCMPVSEETEVSAIKLPTEQLASKTVEIGSSCSASASQSGDFVSTLLATEPIESHDDPVNCVSSCLTIVPSEVSSVLKCPTPSVSPRINSGRKSLRTSSMVTASQKDFKVGSKPDSEAMNVSLEISMKSDSSKALTSQTSKAFLAPTAHLAASLQRGLDIIDGYRKSSPVRGSSFRFSCRPAESKLTLLVEKIDKGVQTYSQYDEMPGQGPTVFLCQRCKNNSHFEVKDSDGSSNMQLVPVESLEGTDKCKTQVPKAVEKVLAGAIRREMALEEYCGKQTFEIMQLNRLVQQYKHERECNAIIGQTREDKIIRLESLMDGVLPTEEFMHEEFESLACEFKLLKEKHENHPEVLKANIELKRLQDELENYRNFYDLGEREVLLEEIQDLRCQLQYYIDSSSSSTTKRNSLLKLTYSCEPSSTQSLMRIQESTPDCAEEKSTENSAEEKIEQERIHWAETESKWISLAEELRAELDACRVLAGKQKQELDTEKRCVEELKEAMQMAMEGHARMLEQYADLEEKHIQLLARNRKIREGIDDIKKAASRAGVRVAESKFINSLAVEISELKAEREKERRYFRDENRRLQAQLRDTAEAVQAAGELLVKLKEAEEAVTAAQKRAMKAEKEAASANEAVNKMRRKHEEEMSSLNQLLAEARQSREGIQPTYNDGERAKYDDGEPISEGDELWREEFKPFYNGEDELAKLVEPSSWFSGYDRCNI